MTLFVKESLHTLVTAPRERMGFFFYYYYRYYCCCFVFFFGGGSIEFLFEHGRCGTCSQNVPFVSIAFLKKKKNFKPPSCDQ